MKQTQIEDTANNTNIGWEQDDFADLHLVNHKNRMQ